MYTLNCLQHSHIAEIFELRSSPEVNRYLDRDPAVCLEDAGGFIKRILEAESKNESWFRVILHQPDGAFTGTICFWNFSPDRKEAEIGYELLPRWQGKGIMNQVLPMALDIGFRQLQLQKIRGFMHPGNSRSARLLEKHGFKIIDTKGSKEICYELNRPFASL